MERRFQEAWNMGFDDAEAGRDQRPTPCPDEIKTGTTAYAAVAFARELYHMGYYNTYNTSIDANRVTQFNDVVRIAQNERIVSRMGVN